ncbi:AfsR/SARP family transcriptional regulator [Nonomuraea recticatena]|uniref:AfsR/SARP family transcriptional regulator n=1 Tax=Nonomuraea recticatena TaxID=46178 RepID=UPI0036110560
MGPRGAAQRRREHPYLRLPSAPGAVRRRCRRAGHRGGDQVGGRRLPAGRGPRGGRRDGVQADHRRRSGGPQAGEVAEASRLLRGALALWRGPAFEGLGGAFFEGRRAWLEQLRASAMEERWALDIARGDCGEAIADLLLATAATPYRERLWELLMWALDRDGRPVEALSAYDRIVRLLDDNLGLEPGPGLRRMYVRIRTAADASFI